MFGRVVFVVLILFVSSAAFAQDQLSGVVRDGRGAVAAGATIVVRQTSSTFERLIDSGRDGRFSLAPIDAGEYDVEVIAPGFAVLLTKVQVPGGRPLELTLAPAPVVEAVQ